MSIRIKFFGHLKEAFGSELELEQTFKNIEELKTYLKSKYSQTNWEGVAVAVNKKYAEPQTRINPEDEVALIPPVSGG